MNRFLLSIFLLMQSANLLGQIQIGERLQLAEMKLSPVNNQEIDPTKYIVLDFWATWCAPCIASFPHLEKLQKKYAESVQIVALSDEPISKVADFLKNKTYSFAFYTDPQLNMFRLFEIEIRPTTCILQPDGKLIWVGSSANLDTVLGHCLNQKNLSNQSKTNSSYPFQKYYTSSKSIEAVQSIYEYKVCYSNKNDKYAAKTQKGNWQDSAINIYYSAVSISEILLDLLNISDLQLTNTRPELDTILINLIAKSHSNPIRYNDEVKRILSDLEKLFDFRIQEETKNSAAYHLIVVDSAKLLAFQEKTEGGGMVATTNGEYEITRLSLQELSGFFQRKLKLFVFYEGNQVMKFNLRLKEFNHIEQLKKQLSEKYGLGLEKGGIEVRTFEIH